MAIDCNQWLLLGAIGCLDLSFPCPQNVDGTVDCRFSFKYVVIFIFIYEWQSVRVCQTQTMRAESPKSSIAQGIALGKRIQTTNAPCKGNYLWHNRVALTGCMDCVYPLPRALPWASYVIHQILDDFFVLIYVTVTQHKPEESTHNSHQIFSRLVPLQPKFSTTCFWCY